MAVPWEHASYIVEKAPLYDRWDRRWQELTARLDADPGHPGLCGVLIEGVRTAEVLRNDAALTERWDLDPPTLSRLMAVQTWDVPTIGHWLGLSERRVRRILKDDGPVPKEALVTAVVPLVLPTVTSRRARAWILTVAELVAATT